MADILKQVVVPDLANPISSSQRTDSTRTKCMLFGGNFWTGSTDQGLRDGFRETGWLVQDVDYGYIVGGPVQSRLSKVVSRVSFRARIRDYHRRLIEDCESLKPDVLFTVKGWSLTPELLARFKGMGTKIICFYPDFHFNHQGIDVQSLKQFDMFVSSKSFHMAYLTELGMGDRAHFVPHGYCSAAHLPLSREIREQDYDADIGYIGNHSPAKQRWLVGLKHAAPELDIKIMGHRWESELSGADRDLVKAGIPMSLRYSDAIQKARINVAVHLGRTAGSGEWEDLVSTRSFEIPACGGFMLHVDNPEIREYFTPGREIDVFSTVEELADKCRFYLHRPELRREMIGRAYQRCVPAYSYARRAAEISDLIEHAFPLGPKASTETDQRGIAIREF
ncbi:hypothetical protein BQ8794_50224 [Mesorhizobium prunaredense]|uniref:Spore protein YkvP/CgeB glycosyl transferase-like domain-containing protein n=1 Tax=Mesorhizobium prunaredense TaxID=1631249 RepID=A0A1R3VFU9_9HYPH|nr:glycosyltransferase [Mesorhizobium prunaredense]SIT58122.1 hypothetical protein BQ8794_50224 [Mesorhizobium prunaredense]